MTLKHHLLTGALALTLLTPPAMAGELIVGNGDSGSSDDVGSVDSDTGVFTLISDVEVIGGQVSDYAVDPSGDIWMINIPTELGDYPSLWKLDRQTGVISVIGVLASDTELYRASSLGFGPNGELFATAHIISGGGQSVDNVIVTIDREPSAGPGFSVAFITEITPFDGSLGAEDLAFNCAGDLLITSEGFDGANVLLKVDIIAGTTTVVGPTIPVAAGSDSVTGLAYDPILDLLYGTTFVSDELVVIDQATGATTTVALLSGINLTRGAAYSDGLASCPAPDADGDGVNDTDDLCPNTPYDESDFPTKKFGTNRHLVVDGVMTQNRKHGAVPSDLTLLDTRGCACSQILAACDAAGAGYGNGHYKFGCSSSVLDAWANGSGNAGVPHPDGGFRCE